MFFTIGIIQEFLLKEVIMPFLTRARVVFGIWKEVTWTKAYKVELADILIIKVISHLKPNVQRIIPVGTHQLVKFFSNVVHI